MPIPPKKKHAKGMQDFIQFSANPVTNENLKSHSRIGMYKRMNRVIEKEKGGFLVRVGIRLVLATDNETLC
ncbi:hypothetical protein CN425_02675 [Bacillus cereus]|uniref:Uncharacterized protein n=1 Tax=Bacillus cereus TaxID=1396 RepID=A0A2A8Q1M1_BACCE|nr:hypothetical protein CON38_20110 [Bacillus cereus]PEW06078.1 hypothetical protein CN425_02675 [Bacillus cereus]